MHSRPFQKGPLVGNDVGSIAFSDHMNISNNFNKKYLSHKCLEVSHLDAPFYQTPLSTPKVKVLETMLIWVFRQGKKSGKLARSLVSGLWEAAFRQQVIKTS